MIVMRKSIYSGRLRLACGFLGLMIAAVTLAGCAQLNAVQATPTQAASATLPPTATEMPSPTPTLPPTATVEPSATLTLPPTATSVPPLALADAGGFNAWCAPLSYAGYTPTSSEAPFDARLLVVNGDAMQVQIPAAYCVIVFQFNQAAPADASLVMYDDSSAFLKQPLKAVDGNPNALWTTVSHEYVVNPPYWGVTYRVALVDKSSAELWSHNVDFNKALPTPCQYGGLPDPVTGYCAITDPKEIEPHPDITFPAYYTREPPSQ